MDTMSGGTGSGTRCGMENEDLHRLDHDDEETEEFYEQIDSIIATVPKKDMLIVQGDWNAKVGPDAYQNWAGTTGKFGIGETNDRGLRLLEFAKSHRLTLTNTLHPHKLSRNATWHSPNGQVHNQIDFILTPQCYKSSINKANTRTFPGADIGSDHDLVLATFKLKLKCKRCPRNPRIRFDLEKLKDPEIADVFQAQVGGKFAALNLMDIDVDTLANNIKEVLTTTAEQVVGKKRKRIQPWVTNEVLDLCGKRRELRKKKHSSNEARTKHQQVNREVRTKMKAAKENWIEEQCEEVEKGMEAGNSKRAYDILKTLTKTSQPRSAVIKDKDGKLLTDSEEVLKRWTEYCDSLYNYQLNPDSSILQDNPRSTDYRTTPHHQELVAATEDHHQTKDCTTREDLSRETRPQLQEPVAVDVEGQDRMDTMSGGMGSGTRHTMENEDLCRLWVS
ncbi:uncharacterized protein LOC143276040 [Babylonia areolata]|uniref:uncharacterized protein LOC143276040 n=1 Tax=Babylonia areolata TaxID=304850 RepID=UPI003FD33183